MMHSEKLINIMIICKNTILQSSVQWEN